LGRAFTAGVDDARTGSTPGNRYRFEEKDFRSLGVTVADFGQQPTIERMPLAVD
jgi:hypothetical protein